MTVVFYPRPRLLSALDLDRHAVIEASAGTGKTFLLQNLIVEFVLRANVSIDEILVVTFTDKATREMRQRIRVQFMDMVAAYDERRSSDGDEVWRIDDVACQRLRAALRSFDRAPISTFHGFCQRTLSEYALETGRAFELEPIEPRSAFGRVFRDLLREILAGQSEVRTAFEAELAKSDLATIEGELYQWYCEVGTPQPRLNLGRLHAGLTSLPTVEEFAGLEPAIQQAFQRTARTVVRRLWQLCAIADDYRAESLEDVARLATTVGDLLSWKSTGVIATQPAAEFLVRELPAAARFQAKLSPLAHALPEILQHVAPPSSILVADVVPEIRRRLDRDKERTGQVDFSDLIRFLAQAVETSDALVSELRQRYRYALVDEFQDTDELQWSILRNLFFATQDLRPTRLFVIGDPKQAIYGFRNADVYTYRAAIHAIQTGPQPGQHVSLADNYRSRPAVVDAYNRILEGFFTGENRYPNPVRSAVAEARLVTPDGDEARAITLLALRPGGTLSSRQARECIREGMAREIRRILDGEVVRRDRADERRIQPSDIHVLTRNRKEELEVAETLRRHRIPVALFKQEGLFQTHEAEHLKALLMAIEHPGDVSCRIQAWLTPFFDIDLAEVHPAGPVDAAHPLVATLYRWHEIAQRGDLAGLFQTILEESGLVRRLLFFSPSERELTNYLHILEALLIEARGRRLHELNDLLRRLVRDEALLPGENANMQRLETERQAVQVLTMHRAKGLEAEVVFLYGGLGPSKPKSGNEPQVFHDENGNRAAWMGSPPPAIKDRIRREAREEDERLLYVALTRARSRLVLPYFGPGASGEPSALSLKGGTYRLLHDRLIELVTTDETTKVHFEIRVVSRDRPEENCAHRPDVVAEADAEFLPTPQCDSNAATLRDLSRTRAGFVMTSYSRMKRLAELDRESFAAETFDTEAVERSPEELPGGSNTGTFLHYILEHLDYRWLSVPDLVAFGAQPEVESLISRALRIHGISRTHTEATKRLVWQALTTPIEMPGLSLPRGFCTVDQHVNEMNFLYPIPEARHPPLSEPPGPAGEFPFRVERGFVRGVIDVVFEHRGRVYFVDWKSDRLPTYGSATVQGHVEEHYSLQAQLYTLGIVRMLRVHDEASYDAKFGGLLYCYLRGMRDDEGLYFARPRFGEVQQWERNYR